MAVGSLRAYAKHRGCRPFAVSKAIDSGRLKLSVKRVDGKIVGVDFDLADQEWAANTNAVKAPTKTRSESSAAAPAPPSPPSPPKPSIEPKRQAPSGQSAAPADDDLPERRELEPGELYSTLNDALTAEKTWKAKLAELQFMEKRGELVDAKDVEARIVDEYARCRTKLLGLARKAKAQIPHLTHADVVTLDNLVREALEDLAGTDDPPAERAS